MSANATTISKFLNDLNTSGTGAYFSILALPSKVSVFLPTADTEAVAAKIADLSKNNNVYVSIALCNTPPAQGRGTTKDASCLLGFFGDFDTLEKPNAKGKYPTTKAVALSIIKELPFAPTILNDSGYGVHGLWLFPEPLAIHSEEHRAQLQSLFRRFQAMLKQAFQRHGYELDSGIGDLVRVFRVPGTYNRRDASAPVPVSVLEHHPQNTVTVEEVQAYLDQHFPEEKSRLAHHEDEKKTRPNAELIRTQCAWFEHCIVDAPTLSQPEWYAHLSITGRCMDGARLAHEYGKPYPQYTPAETDKKLAEALQTAGPRTCTNIRNECGGEEYCKACPHWGKITSPIQLGNPSEEAQNMKAQLLAAADRLEFWHTKNDTAYATIRENGYKQNIILNCKKFRKWLTHKIRKSHGRVVTKQAVEEVLTALDAEAIFDGEEYDVHYRVAAHGGNLYIDLGNDNWSALEVRPDGWSIIPEPPVRFVRSDSMQPLPIPERGGSIDLLRKYIPCDSDDDFKLLVGLVVGIFSPYKPYPIGIFTGLQGSGKTTRARAIIRITDPSTAELVMAPKEDRDVLASTSARWLTSFDNVKKISHSVSDALCCVCTGISYSAREYYTTLSSYETAEIARPMLMTAVQIRLNQDLRSRAICFDFSPLTSCKTESKYWREYDIDAPKILGALLDALSCALRNYAAANEYEGELPRMADHTVWVTAAEEALGWESGTYRNLLLQHQQEGMKDSDANSTLVRAALGFFQYEAAGWKASRSYTVTEMYQGIMQWASNKEHMPKDELKYLPRSPAAFSKKLRNYIPSLKLYGITIAFDDNDRGNKRAVTVSLSPEFIEECTTSLY